MKQRFRVRHLGVCILGSVSLLLVIFLGPQAFPVTERAVSPSIGVRELLAVQAASAQRLSIDDVSQQLYDSMPFLPLENEYIDAETGEVDVNNTLVSRLIRYHLYVARRSPEYRLDWKISLADYLNVTGHWLQGDTYPGEADLEMSPRNGDIDAINQLNRAERDALVQELVTVFTSSEGRLPTFLSR